MKHALSTPPTHHPARKLYASQLSTLALAAIVACGPSALAQSGDATKSATTPAKAMTDAERYDDYRAHSVDRTYPLHYAFTSADQNETLTALRNLLNVRTKMFLVPSQNVIVVQAPPEEQAEVASLLTSVDKPRSRYRLTFTLSELDGTRRIGTDHFSITVLNGQRGVLKEGSRVPISAGEAQYTYIDVGMNFDATFTETQGGGVLRSKVEQTSIAPDSTTPGKPNPVIRQTMLDSTAPLTLGKPMLLGSLGLPNSTHHLEVEALVEVATDATSAK